MRSIDTTLATRVFSGLPTPAQLDSDLATPRGAAFQQNQRRGLPRFAPNQLVSPADSQFSPNRAVEPSRASGARTNSNATADDDENGSDDAAPATQGRTRWQRTPYGPRTTGFLSNGERARYHQLLDYPLADTPLPAGTTCLDIITRYPNHFSGENLEAFLQYFWSAEMIASLTPTAVKDLWKSQGIHGPNSRPANFVRNRMDTYAERMGKDRVRRLIAEPKKRPSGLHPSEEYGRSDPLGLGLNDRRPRTARTGPRKARVLKEPDSTTVVQPSALPPVNPAPAPVPAPAAPPAGINSGSSNVDTSGVAQAAVMDEAASNLSRVTEGDDVESGSADAVVLDANTTTQL
jgi:hypothetical protein